MTFFVLDSNNIAVDYSAAAPTVTDRGLLVNKTTYSGMTLSVKDLSVTLTDFVGGKYRLNTTATGLELNPAYVAPAAPAALPVLSITAITSDTNHPATIASNFSEVTCPTGTILTVKASLSAPISSTFRMPIVSSDGRERFVLVTFVSGAATFSVTMNESGLWEVTETRINRDMPAASRMRFAGIKVYVTL